MIARNETVDALRGLAALAVASFHFTNGPHFKEVSILHPITAHGWIGVPVFFVISGYIVPYAMLRGGYQLAHWPTFMAKRLIRLEPPYLISIALVIVLGYLSASTPGFRGTAPDYSALQIISHVGYLTSATGYSWINPVYWTLAIELQFYLLISLALPALSRSKPFMGLIMIIGFAASAILPARFPSICQHAPIFSLGLILMMLHSRKFTISQSCIALTAAIALTAYVHGIGPALAAIVTTTAIAAGRMPRVPVIAWLGAISYSLYLVHVPVGGRIINLATRLEPTPLTEIVAVMIATSATIAVAWVLYTLIESPSKTAAARLSYLLVADQSHSPMRY